MAILANAVLIVHVAFIAFVVVGLLLILVGGILGWAWVRNPWFRGSHLAAIGLVVLQAWLGIECPLTTLETALRIQAGQEPYAESGFIATWLHRLIFFDADPWVFILIYTLFGLATAATLIAVPVRLRKL